MFNLRKVVVTGVGCISPLGADVQSTWEGLLAGRSGISQITRFEPGELASRIAGQADDFDPELRLATKEARRMDRFIQLGLCAGLEAFEDSGIDLEKSDRDRIGVLIGAGIGGLETIENTTRVLSEKGPRKVSPFYIPSSIINMVSGNLSIMLGLRGPNLAVVTACTTGTHAIGEAGRMIALGDAEVMIAGGTEAAITPTSIAGFTAAKALSRRNDAPERASRPWDRDRDGFVMGEGAGTLVIESLEHAKSRGARIYAELAGYGVSGDAHHMTQPAPGGEGAARCMRNALKNAGIDPQKVGYVNAHGTSTPLGDLAETLAIKSVFASHAYDLMLSSNKSMIGHLLGAAGGVEAVATVLSLFHNAVPPTINLDGPDPDCDLDYVPADARDAPIQAALSNSFGFGGTNGTLVFTQL
ncbi:MAG: beta-ketoacyl-[acyl-carrier-protein] synthase II [Acidiferrobacteraceae bacterium]|jgi:3-oxoacyl-[acyl-carrier-protein] synthase II|nr:beta-ketoacyl-[acyl-carrier-protein] synthase II [Acidiferrobacteraceae bacterium]MDP6552286.1 beta-ketoacyl-ACP synthase II [Arenicellales bacterium]MDP6790427.1 beta-ketoacyl-ACP synthase II [Arenicellales bacterium]MDP6919552.1 beta-ketoacyl-ACP synthase II [Arenicellales bacterium]|tara:strand:+ start:40053 stop:41294 length:1242 start_codon:yes stop_codon:yes gene_type:complete